MERQQLTHLTYITPIDNLRSILELGILSHNRAKALKTKSIAAQEIQDRRSGKRVPQGRLLHDHVNLYFNPRNPMMYKRKGMHASICVLCVDSCVIDHPDVVISDQNAASEWVRFAAAPKGLEIVDAERTFALDWTKHDDQRVIWRHKAQMCAEVLVPDCVAPNLIIGAYVSCQPAKTTLEGSGFVLPIELRSGLFFQ